MKVVVLPRPQLAALVLGLRTVNMPKVYYEGISWKTVFWIDFFVVLQNIHNVNIQLSLFAPNGLSLIGDVTGANKWFYVESTCSLIEYCSPDKKYSINHRCHQIGPALYPTARSIRPLTSA